MVTKALQYFKRPQIAKLVGITKNLLLQLEIKVIGIIIT